MGDDVEGGVRPYKQTVNTFQRWKSLLWQTACVYRRGCSGHARTPATVTNPHTIITYSSPNSHPILTLSSHNYHLVLIILTQSSPNPHLILT